MSHAKYCTDAIVLYRFETGEADLTLLILTPEFGSISAHAQGARRESGKMRAHIQTFATARVTLVRGKHTWRLTGVEASSAPVAPLRGESLQAFTRIVTFVRRMTLNNEASADIFDAVLQARTKLPAYIEKEQIENTELETIATILASLGYLSTDILREHMTPHALARAVNTAIKESHL